MHLYVLDWQLEVGARPSLLVGLHSAVLCAAQASFLTTEHRDTTMPPRPAVLLSAWRLAQLRRQAAVAAGGTVHRLAARALSSATGTSAPGLQRGDEPEAAQHPRRGLEERSGTRLAVGAPPVVHHSLYSAPQLPPGHRFPMASAQQGSGSVPQPNFEVKQFRNFGL